MHNILLLLASMHTKVIIMLSYDTWGLASLGLLRDILGVIPRKLGLQPYPRHELRIIIRLLCIHFVRRPHFNSLFSLEPPPIWKSKLRFLPNASLRKLGRTSGSRVNHISSNHIKYINKSPHPVNFFCIGFSQLGGSATTLANFVRSRSLRQPRVLTELQLLIHSTGQLESCPKSVNSTRSFSYRGPRRSWRRKRRIPLSSM